MCVSWELLCNKLPHFRHHRPDNGIIQQKPNSVNEVIPIIIMEEKKIRRLYQNDVNRGEGTYCGGRAFVT